MARPGRDWTTVTMARVKCPLQVQWIKSLDKEIHEQRSWQDSNLRSQWEIDFKSIALTARPQLLISSVNHCRFHWIDGNWWDNISTKPPMGISDWVSPVFRTHPSSRRNRTKATESRKFPFTALEVVEKFEMFSMNFTFHHLNFRPSALKVKVDWILAINHITFDFFVNWPTARKAFKIKTDRWKLRWFVTKSKLFAILSDELCLSAAKLAWRLVIIKLMSDYCDILNHLGRPWNPTLDLETIPLFAFDSNSGCLQLNVNYF